MVLFGSAYGGRVFSSGIKIQYFHNPHGLPLPLPVVRRYTINIIDSFWSSWGLLWIGDTNWWQIDDFIFDIFDHPYVGNTAITN